MQELADNISDTDLDDVISDIPVEDDVRTSIDDAINYDSLRNDDKLTNRLDEYKHRRWGGRKEWGIKFFSNYLNFLCILIQTDQRNFIVHKSCV